MAKPDEALALARHASHEIRGAAIKAARRALERAENGLAAYRSGRPHITAERLEDVQDILAQLLEQLDARRD